MVAVAAHNAGQIMDLFERTLMRLHSTKTAHSNLRVRIEYAIISHWYEAFQLKYC